MSDLPDVPTDPLRIVGYSDIDFDPSTPGVVTVSFKLNRKPTVFEVQAALTLGGFDSTLDVFSETLDIVANAASVHREIVSTNNQLHEVDREAVAAHEATIASMKDARAALDRFDFGV